MPILDHFRPPLYPVHSWESFHMRWAGVIADTLDRTLPPRFFAEVHTHLGTHVSSDVAEFEQTAEHLQAGNGSGGVAVQTWAPPTATMILPFVFPDDLEVRVLDERDDARLVAVVELVSPRNKDRPEARRAFAAKCAAYLQRGVGVVMADIVTTRQANMHNELIDLLRLDETFRQAPDVFLAALAYRPAHRDGQDQVDVLGRAVAGGWHIACTPAGFAGDWLGAARPGGNLHGASAAMPALRLNPRFPHHPSAAPRRRLRGTRRRWGIPRGFAGSSETAGRRSSGSAYAASR